MVHLPQHIPFDSTTIPQYGLCYFEISCKLDIDFTPFRRYYLGLEISCALTKKAWGYDDWAMLVAVVSELGQPKHWQASHLLIDLVALLYCNNCINDCFSLEWSRN